jgi:hypothetical protein
MWRHAESNPRPELPLRFLLVDRWNSFETQERG